MTISRAQMRRQLYMGGGIASLEPRQQYGLGSIVKSVKKAVKGVGDAIGDIASSDAGKLALLYAGTAGLGHLGAGGSFGGLFKAGTYAPSMVGSNLLTSATRAGVNLGLIGSSGVSLPTVGKTAKIAGGILGGSALLTSLFGSVDQAQEAFNRDPSYVKSMLEKYGKSVGKEGDELKEFVNQNIAEFGDVARSDVVSGYENYYGGRLSAADGGLSVFNNYQNYMNELQDAQQQSIGSPLYNPTISYQTGDGDENSNFGKQDDVETGNLNTGPGFRETITDALANMREGRYNAGKGILGGVMFGPLGYSRGFFRGRSDIGVDDVNDMSIGINMDALYGDDPSPGPGPGDPGGGSPTPGDTDGTPFAEGGIPSIPTGELRENAQGVQELDYRQDGGFVPVGIKEKADDVPAMLSKNEFVMTADAVRGMGNGSIENGAQKMYNLMKSLENRMA